MLVYLCLVYDCYWVELSSCNRDHVSAKLKMFTIWPCRKTFLLISDPEVWTNSMNSLNSNILLCTHSPLCSSNTSPSWWSGSTVTTNTVNLLFTGGVMCTRSPAWQGGSHSLQFRKLCRGMSWERNLPLMWELGPLTAELKVGGTKAP